MTHATKKLAVATTIAALALACDSSSRPLGGSLAVPEAREARVTLTPALDVTGIVDSNLAARLVIDEIVVNVSDLRLLGANPQIPAAGHVLQDRAKRLSTLDGHARYPFPSNWLEDDLAIYMHVDPSPELDGASVVVRARLFERPVSAAHMGLRSSDDEAPNPDGEPANEGDDDEAPNPDGEPANEDGDDQAPNPDGEPASGGDEAPNPDGEPAVGGSEAPNPDGEPANECDDDSHDCIEAIGSTQKSLDGGQLRASRWVPFELRGEDIVELVVGFDRDSRLDVLLGIPAKRWFTQAVINQLESALHDVSLDEQVPGAEEAVRKPVIVDRESPTASLNDGDREDRMREEQDSYSLVDDDAVDPEDLRRR